MIDASLREELLKQLEQLSPNLQRRVVEFAAALVQSVPKGTPGNQLLRFAGVLAPEDAREMIEAIEAGCERVEDDE